MFQVVFLFTLTKYQFNLNHTFSDLKEGEVNIMKITYELVGVLAYPYEWLFVSL